MRPKAGSFEAALLQILRELGPTPVGIEQIVCHDLMDGKKGDIVRAIGRLRGMGYEILDYRTPPKAKKGQVYAYQLKLEARAEDPFKYLRSILGRNREVVINQPHHRIRLSRDESEGRELIVVGLFHSRRPKARDFEHYVIDDRGVVSFSWDEEVSGASSVIPVMVVGRSGYKSTIEEQMLIDHIRAHIVQLYVQRAVEKYGVG